MAVLVKKPPGFDQSTVNCELLIGQEALGLDLIHNLLEKRRGHFVLQQAGPDSW